MYIKRILLLALCLANVKNAQSQQSYSITKISEDANIRSDQRPISIGFYDKSINKTFITWMGEKSKTIVKAYDHTAKKWSDDKIVGTPTFIDKHNYPGMLKGADNRLYIFYGCHNSTMRMTISPKPLSIDGSWEDQFIPIAEKASYPAPIITSDGTFYVFYRETRQTNKFSDDRPYQFVKSTDNGKTWTKQMAIDPFPRVTDNMCEVYNGKVTYQPAMNGNKAKIHLAWTIAGEKLGKHAHATYGRNVYYAYLDPSNDHLYSIKGKDLGKTIEAKELDEFCQVLDTGIPETGHLAGLQVSVHYRDNGLPLIYFDNQVGGGPGSATWDGNKWIFASIETPGNSIRDLRDPRELEKFGADSFRVYKPSEDSIKVYITTNGGKSWQFENSIKVGQKVDRVHTIDNAHPSIKLMITEAGDNTLDVAKRDVFIGSIKK
ncbi:BNR-4 repeat-containing protein [Pedobacter sp. UC225_61]|uniref:BNR-4 repeat-containing protein n=1 Tax=Pedobacter sp. UC225_61 TaxID=3374623 RepID=UPI003788162F